MLDGPATGGGAGISWLVRTRGAHRLRIPRAALDDNGRPSTAGRAMAHGRHLTVGLSPLLKRAGWREPVVLCPGPSTLYDLIHPRG